MLIISISAILCDNVGILGMLIDVVFLIFAAKMTGNLFDKINEALMRTEPNWMRNLNGVNSGLHHWHPFRRNRDGETAASR